MFKSCVGMNTGTNVYQSMTLRVLILLCCCALLSACGGGGGGHAGRVFYVSEQNGDDSKYDGRTVDTPFSSIHAAIKAALSGDEIRVAQGDYNTNIDNAPAYSIEKSIELKGGYSLDFSEQDSVRYPTTIYNAYLYINKTIAADPLIEGFVIDRSSRRSTASIILIEQGAPIIRNNKIVVSDSISMNGIYVWGGSPLIEQNEFIGTSEAIEVSDGAPTIRANIVTDVDYTSMQNAFDVRGGEVIIEDNVINGGAVQITGSMAGGIRFWLNSPSGVVRRNIINGGIAVETPQHVYIYNNIIYAGEGDGTSGVSIVNGQVKVLNNTIHGGSGTYTTAISVSSSDDLSVELQNNILMSEGDTAYCIGVSNTLPQSIRNNNFSLCKDAAFHTYQSSCPQSATVGTVCTLNELQALSDANSQISGNIESHVVLVDIDGPDDILSTMQDNNWRLSMDTEANIRQGGLNLFAILQRDMDGVLRSAVLDGKADNADAAGWSMGAYELD